MKQADSSLLRLVCSFTGSQRALSTRGAGILQRTVFHFELESMEMACFTDPLDSHIDSHFAKEVLWPYLIYLFFCNP